MSENTIPTADTPFPEGWEPKVGEMVWVVSANGRMSGSAPWHKMIGMKCRIKAVSKDYVYVFHPNGKECWYYALTDLRPVSAPRAPAWPEAEFLAGRLAIVSETVEQRREVLARLLDVLPEGYGEVFEHSLDIVRNGTYLKEWPGLCVSDGKRWRICSSKNGCPNEISAATFFAATAHMVPKSPHTGPKQTVSSEPTGPYRPLSPGEPCGLCATYDWRMDGKACPRCGKVQQNPMMVPRRRHCLHLRLLESRGFFWCQNALCGDKLGALPIDGKVREVQWEDGRLSVGPHQKWDHATKSDEPAF